MNPFWLENLPPSWDIVPGRHLLRVSKDVPGAGKADEYQRLSLTMAGVLPRSREASDGLQPESFDSYQLLRPGQLVFKLLDLENVATSRVGLSLDEGLVSPAYIVATPSPRLDSRFAYYYFYSLYLGRVFNAIAGDGVRSGLGAKDLKEIPIPSPPLSVQGAIVNFLRRETAQTDMLIAKSEKLIELLAERKRAILPAELDHLAGDSIKLRYLYGPSKRANCPHETVLSVYREHGVVIKTSRSDNFNVTPENLERYLLVRPGDVVVNRMKAWQGSLGVSTTRGIVSGDYEVLRPRGAALTAAFANYSLRSPTLVAEYAARSTGIRPSQWRLYWDQMGDIPVTVPSVETQQEVASRIYERLGSIDRGMETARRAIALARERRAALIAAAVTGQIDVGAAA